MQHRSAFFQCWRVLISIHGRRQLNLLDCPRSGGKKARRTHCSDTRYCFTKRQDGFRPIAQIPAVACSARAGTSDARVKAFLVWLVDHHYRYYSGDLADCGAPLRELQREMHATPLA